MREFKTIQRVEIEKRDPKERSCDFREIYTLLNRENAKLQASRCVQCGNPFCHSSCPLHNYIPYWLLKTAKEDLKSAFEISNFTNPFPEITGRVCPQDRLCEGACTLGDGYGAINIGAIETHITENGLHAGYSLKFPTEKIGKKVAIIGAGPAGLSASNYLLKSGIDVDIYDENSVAGGLLSIGIPGFKLDKSVVNRRVNILKDAGANFILNKKVGKDISFEKLLLEYDALFLGFGARVSKMMNLKNENLCFGALDFLTLIQNELNGGEKIDIKDKKVLVVGGGDTAMDCLRSAIRKGANSATCLYRRSKNEMGGSKKEFLNASVEGANFIFNTTPKEILLNENGDIIGLNAQKTTIKNRVVETIKGSEFRVDADIIIFALGFDVENLSFLAENGIQTDKNGRILVDSEFKTSCTGVFAGGDCIRGSSLVVNAASDGKKAAQNIIKYIL